MTQVQDMQKRYATPVLTVYGRIEEITLVYSNPTSQDNMCPGAIGSQNLNSGVFCAPTPSGGGSANTTAIDSDIVSPVIEDPLTAPIDPIAEEMTGGSASS